MARPQVATIIERPPSCPTAGKRGGQWMSHVTWHTPSALWSCPVRAGSPSASVPYSCNWLLFAERLNPSTNRVRDSLRPSSRTVQDCSCKSMPAFDLSGCTDEVLGWPPLQSLSPVNASPLPSPIAQSNCVGEGQPVCMAGHRHKASTPPEGGSAAVLGEISGLMPSR